MLTNKEYIDLFMTRSMEKTIDEAMLSDKNFIVPSQKVKDYIHTVIDIPYGEFIDYCTNNIGHIEDDQLTQSSSFESCTSKMCDALIWQGNPGLRHVEIGKLFPDKIRKKNDQSFQKYGENQIKTASQLGLAFEYYGYWYLTCVGYIFNQLTEKEKDSFLARSILRTPLYRSLITSLLERDVSLMEYMTSLADSTKGRRAGSILKLVKICLNECNKEGILYHNIDYPYYDAVSKRILVKVISGTY